MSDRIKRIVLECVNLVLLIPLFMVLSTVFVVDRSLANGIVSGKYFWFYLAIGIATVSTIILYGINRRKIKVSLVDILILLFGCLGGAVTYYHNLRFSNDLILFILIIILYFYFKISHTQFNKTFYYLLLFFMISGLVEAIWGLKQLYGLSSSQHHLFKTTGSFFNPGPFGGYISVVVPVALYYLIHDYRILDTKKFRLLLLPFYLRWTISLSTFTSILLVLPSTMSRASWIAAFGGCCISYLLFFFRKKSKRVYILTILRKRRKVILSTSIIAVTLLCVLCIGLYNIKKDSADGRALIWKTAIETIKNNPFGVGIGNFSGIYGLQQAKYFESGIASEQEQLVAGNPEYAFNEFLQICIEHGIISFLIFISVIGLSIYMGLKRRNYAPLGSLIAFSVFSLMSYPLNLLPFVIIFVFLISLINKENTYNKEKHSFKVYLFLTICLMSVSLCIYDRYPTYDAYKKWNKAKTLYNVGLYEDASKEYEKYIHCLDHEVPFLFEYAQSLSKNEKYDKSNIVLVEAVKISCDPMLYNIMGKNYQALKNYDKAKECFIIASNIVPHRLYPYYLLGKLYDEMGDATKVCEIAQIVQEKEPKVHSPAIEEMRSEMKVICIKYKSN